MIETILTSAAVLLRVISNPASNVFQKQLTQRGHHPLIINFFTYLSLSVVCIFVAANTEWRSLPAACWFYAVAAGLVGGIGNGFLVKALQKGDLSVLGPVNSYKSVVGMVVGIILLNEIPNVWGLLGVALIIWGSYFVLDTTSERFSWALLKRPEIRYRIWAMILTAIEAVFIKKIIQMSSTTIAFIFWCGFGALFSFLFLLISKVEINNHRDKLNNTSTSRFLYLLTCVGTMQITTNYAFDHMPVGYALSLFQLSTIISVLLGYRYFNEKDIRKKLLGAGIMIVGSVVIIQFKDR